LSTYALIHGAYGSGALWEPLARELEARGHTVVAPDLPAEDPDASFGDYADAVEAALDGRADGDLHVVGHSLGGVTAALVASRGTDRRVTYVAAILPEPLRPLADVLRGGDVLSQELAAAEVRAGKGRRRLEADRAAELFFGELEAARARELAGALRPQALAAFFEPCPLDALPAGTYVVCREDRIVSPDWGREASRRLLKASAVELDGGHFPQLARPAELAEVLGA
jgi:pimeloyl-ACP methyl ester carboxylesterase